MTSTTVPALMRSNARSLPLADSSVDLIVTSPPYFGLRSYQDGGEHYDGQVGSEPTPAEFIAALIECTREWMRVLKTSGSIFVNLGDSYGKRKTLQLIPERYRIACVDELGLIARAVLVWSKPNALPESVTDRVRRSHEDWVHLTVQPRYYSSVDVIREEASGYTRAAANRSTPGGQRPRAMADTCNPLGKLPASVWDIPSQPLKVPTELGVDHFAAFPMEWPRRLILGWSPREVCTACGEGRRPVAGVDWDSVPHRIEHRRQLTDQQVADWCQAFDDWCKTAAVTRKALDAVCGTDGMGRHWTNPYRLGSQVPSVEQWDRIVEAFHPPAGLAKVVHSTTPIRVSQFEVAVGGDVTGRHRNSGPRAVGHHRITGYACACPDTSAPSTPGVVLDPFGGTGTTALVATMLDRRGISVDLSADYCRLAQWRTTDPVERARAAGNDTTKVTRTAPGQSDLFGDAA